MSSQQLWSSALGLGALHVTTGIAGIAGAGALAGAVFTRPLTLADLGIQGDAANIAKLNGTFSMDGTNATVFVDLIAKVKGSSGIGNPFQIINSLIDTASNEGATSLTISGSIADPKLLNILVNRYGATTNGGFESVTIPIVPQK